MKYYVENGRLVKEVDKEYYDMVKPDSNIRKWKVPSNEKQGTLVRAALEQ